MSLFTSIFGTYSQRQLRKLKRIVDEIESLAEKYKNMTDIELRSQTQVLKDRLAEGEDLDDILPDAFAVIREADDRVLNKRPFRVQLIGGVILHEGRIAEMKTGEGKTLVATLPAYLNALSGEGVHIVTVNDYLARVGAEEMGRVYEFMGLKTGLIVNGLTKEQKQEAYNADITYGTNNEFGFDYLRDNMAIYKSECMQRGHVFAIVDEVDSILIDEARTPLIISGMGDTATDLYAQANTLASRMKKLVVKEMDKKENYDEADADYVVDEKANNAVLTAKGAKKAEEFFKIENLSNPENSTIAHHVQIAIKAHGCMHRDIDYVVNEKGVMIVDTFTGRLMPGRRYSDGLHQAIEAKEGVEVQKENKTVATITFQNYFRMYKKLSGMTGTALTEEDEFREIYNLDVVEVPTNLPMIREDHPDCVYKTREAKLKAIVNQVKECHKKGQPILVGTVSIEKSEELSVLLKKAGIPHNVLNAKHHEKEAEIVAQAGRLGAVTISTNMAGRGTDILLGGNPEFLAKKQMRAEQVPEEILALCGGFSENTEEEVVKAREEFKKLVAKYKEETAPEAKKVCELGGLYILGTERHESRRIDNQLRGRSGRQGDPGESCFFLSLQDDLMRLFGVNRFEGMLGMMPDDEPINAKILSGAIEQAQKRIESANFKRRKYVLSYDDVMNQQRSIIYAERKQVLEGEDVSEKVKKMLLSFVDFEVAENTQSEDAKEWNFAGLRQHLPLLIAPNDFNYTNDEYKKLDRADIEELLHERALKVYESKEKIFGVEQFREVERSLLLRSVDTAWMEHIDNMEDLKEMVGLQSYAQRDPVNEYRIQGADLFDNMIEDIRNNTARMILSVLPARTPIMRTRVANPISVGFENLQRKSPKKINPVTRKAEPGRNDPCPCGSGKKYKNCCMRKNSGEQ